MVRFTLATAAVAMALLVPTAPLPAQAGAPDSVRRLVDAGRPGEAYVHGRAAVRAAPRDPAALAALAVGAMAVERYDEAVDAADDMAAAAPEVSSYQLVLGQAYLSHARDRPNLGAVGKVKRGRAAVERAIALDPDNLDARYTLMQFLLQAPGIAGGSREGARRQAEEIARRDPRRGLLARVEMAAAAADEAELAAVLDAAAPRLGTPSDPDAELMGALLAAAGTLPAERRGSGSPGESIGRIPGTRWPPTTARGSGSWRASALADAERLLLGYLAGPEWRRGVASRAGAHWRLAQLYERQDRDRVAKEQYRLAASLDPRLKRGKRSAERLESQL